MDAAAAAGQFMRLAGLGDVAAQLPLEKPFETETPLPPSTSGRTSTPPMRIALIDFIRAAPLKG
jgi:hypothetical protein